MANASHTPSPVTGAVRLASILDNRQVVLSRDFQHGVHLRRAAEQMNRKNGPGAAGDFPFDQGRVQIRRVRVNVHKHRLGARVTNGLGGGDEGVGSGNHFVARLYPQGEQSEVQSARAGVQSDTVIDFAIGSKLSLKRPDLLA